MLFKVNLGIILKIFKIKFIFVILFIDFLIKFDVGNSKFVKFNKKNKIKFIKGLVIVIWKVFLGVLWFFFIKVILLNRNKVMELIFIFWEIVIKLWFNLWNIME